MFMHKKANCPSIICVVAASKTCGEFTEVKIF